MKPLIKILALVAVLSAGGCVAPSRTTAQETTVSFQLFYDQLGPYGTWVDYQNYGYVWIPDVDRDFSPYSTNGHWIFTDDGWTWVSDYPWGWAPFHYGRWAYDDSYGWIWVPHNEWGPAWVTWRRSEGYYGWAPMGPGVSVEVSFGGSYRVPNERWTFVSERDISRPDLDRHYVDRSTNVTIINNSTVINNTYVDNSRHTTYVAGPPRDDVQRVTGAPVVPVAIRENDRPGQALNNNQLQIYRPRVQTVTSNDHRPAPSKVVPLKEVKPVSERKPGEQRRNENQQMNGNREPAPVQNAPPPVNNAPVAQPPPARPSDNQGRDQRSPVVTPPEQNRGKEQQLPPEPVKPNENRGRDQRPPVITPPEKNKGVEVPPVQPPAGRPFGNKGRGQQPPVIAPPGRDNGIDQAPQPRNVRPSEKRGKGRPPQNMTPPDKNKKGRGRDSQPPKPGTQQHDSTGTHS
jgi:hypothetical protein